MITLFHGDNVEASRTAFTQQRTSVKDKELRVLDGKTLDPTTLIQSLESSSLFGGDVVVAIEGLLTHLGKKSKSASEFTNILQTSSGAQIFLWEPKDISATMLKALGKNVKVETFKTPVVIFQFLDAIKPSNAKSMIALFGKTVSADAPELVFTMIVRRIRQLLLIRSGAALEGLQEWQAARLTSQARLFTIEELRELYAKLLNIEYSVKSGTTAFSMKDLTEQLLIDL